MTRRLYLLDHVNVPNYFLNIKIYCTKILFGKFEFKSGHSKMELGRVLPEGLGEAVEAQVVQMMASSHLLVSESFSKMSPLQRTYASGAEESHCSDAPRARRTLLHTLRRKSAESRKKSRSAWTSSDFRRAGLGFAVVACPKPLCAYGAQRSFPTNLGGQAVLRGFPLRCRLK